jgi:hypothetical protein
MWEKISQSWNYCIWKVGLGRDGRIEALSLSLAETRVASDAKFIPLDYILIVSYSISQFGGRDVTSKFGPYDDAEHQTAESLSGWVR